MSLSAKALKIKFSFLPANFFTRACAAISLCPTSIVTFGAIFSQRPFRSSAPKFAKFKLNPSSLNAEELRVKFERKNSGKPNFSA